MKKISIFLFGALAMAFASCEDSIDFGAPLQSNPQGPVFETGQISVESLAPLAAGNVDLNNYAGDVPVVKVTEVKDLPETAVVSFAMEYSSNEDFSDAKTLALTNVGDEAMIAADMLNETHISLFGKSPKPKTVYYRVPVYVTIGGTDYRWGGTDYYAVQGKYQEVCKDAGFVIEDAYYFLSNATTWVLGEALNGNGLMNHSDADVYDDPVFTITIESTGDCYWKIGPVSAVTNGNWDGMYGTEVDGDISFTGVLHEGGNAGRIVDPGKYKITVNMETMQYTVVAILNPEYLCTPGVANEWDQGNSQWLYWSEGKQYNCGAVLENEGFKLTDGDNWDDDKTWGMGSEEGKLDQPGGNIPVPAPGLYWVVAKTAEGTYTNTPITSVGVVGDLNEWAPNAPIELTPNADQSIWSGDVEMNGKGWKIIINHSWDSNYGGSLNDLVFDASDFSGVSGKYNVSINFTGNKPVMTLTAK